MSMHKEKQMPEERQRIYEMIHSFELEEKEKERQSLGQPERVMPEKLFDLQISELDKPAAPVQIRSSQAGKAGTQPNIQLNTNFDLTQGIREEETVSTPEKADEKLFTLSVEAKTGTGMIQSKAVPAPSIQAPSVPAPTVNPVVSQEELVLAQPKAEVPFLELETEEKEELQLDSLMPSLEQAETIAISAVLDLAETKVFQAADLPIPEKVFEPETEAAFLQEEDLFAPETEPLKESAIDRLNHSMFEEDVSSETVTAEILAAETLGTETLDTETLNTEILNTEILGTETLATATLAQERLSQELLAEDALKAPGDTELSKPAAVQFASDHHYIKEVKFDMDAILRQVNQKKHEQVAAEMERVPHEDMDKFNQIKAEAPIEYTSDDVRSRILQDSDITEWMQKENSGKQLFFTKENYFQSEVFVEKEGIYINKAASIELYNKAQAQLQKGQKKEALKLFEVICLSSIDALSVNTALIHIKNSMVMSQTDIKELIAFMIQKEMRLIEIVKELCRERSEANVY